MFYKALAKGLATSGKETDVKAVVIPEIDAYNVLSILRAKFWGRNEQQVKEIVVGATSTITDDIIQKMIKAENINDAMIELGNTVYKDITPQLTNDIEIITNLERSFEEILFRKYLGTFRKMFNYATMISIIKLKMIEVRNLAIIASAVELKVPTDNVMSKLLLVE